MTVHVSEPLPDAHQQPASILVVEDNVALRFALAVWLRNLRYIVLEAASAEEAFVLLASPVPVDLVVTDIQMSGNLDGYDLVRYVRKLFPALPVVVVSGEAEQKNIEAIGGSGFFRKPYNFDDVAACVARLLANFSVAMEDAE